MTLPALCSRWCASPLVPLAPAPPPPARALCAAAASSCAAWAAALAAASRLRKSSSTSSTKCPVSGGTSCSAHRRAGGGGGDAARRWRAQPPCLAAASGLGCPSTLCPLRRAQRRAHATRGRQAGEAAHQSRVGGCPSPGSSCERAGCEWVSAARGVERRMQPQGEDQPPARCARAAACTQRQNTDSAE